MRGVRVVGVARSQQALQSMSMEKIGTAPFEYVLGDVTDAAVLQSVVDLAVKKEGNELVGVVLNAATLDPFQRIKDTDTAALKRHFEVNVWSQQVLASLCLPHLRQHDGRIVFLSSGIVEHPMVGWAAYTSAKAAMNAFIRCLAKEEPKVVSVSVKPGIVDTEMVRQSSSAEGVMDSQGEQWIKSMREGGKLLDPQVPGEAIAKIVLSAPRSASGGFFNYNDKQLQQV